MIPETLKARLASAWAASSAFLVVRHRLWFGAGIGACRPWWCCWSWLGASLPISRALGPWPTGR